MAVRGDVARQHLPVLTEQVGQHSGAEPTGGAEGVGRAGAGDPHRKFGLDRRREDADRLLLSGAVGELELLAAPEPPDSVDSVGHGAAAVRVVLRPQREVHRVPAGGERDADPAPRQVVDDRPLLGDAQRMVQRRDHAARADADPLGHGGDGGPGDGRIRVQAAERMEVPLRRPHGGKAIFVPELRAFDQQPVAITRITAKLARKIE